MQKEQHSDTLEFHNWDLHSTGLQTSKGIVLKIKISNAKHLHQTDFGEMRCNYDHSFHDKES